MHAERDAAARRIRAKRTDSTGIKQLARCIERTITMAHERRDASTRRVRAKRAVATGIKRLCVRCSATRREVAAVRHA